MKNLSDMENSNRNTGWISIYRELLEKPIWVHSTPEQKTILITLLLMANHTQREWEWKGEKYVCKPGQFITSLESIKNKAGKGVSIQNIRTAIDRFKKYEFLTSESTNRNRLITICNWELYQDTKRTPNKEDNKPLTSYQQATNKPLTTNNNDNNKNNGDNEEEEEEREKTSTSSKIQSKIYQSSLRPLPEIFDELNANSLWKEQMCMLYSIPGNTVEIKLKNFHNILNRFYYHLSVERQEKEKSLQDTYAHFSNWIKKADAIKYLF